LKESSDNFNKNQKISIHNKKNKIIVLKKPVQEKSFYGLDLVPDIIQKRIPKKPQKYTDEEFESENVNISGKDRYEGNYVSYNNKIKEVFFKENSEKSYIYKKAERKE